MCLCSPRMLFCAIDVILFLLLQKVTKAVASGKKRLKNRTVQSQPDKKQSKSCPVREVADHNCPIEARLVWPSKCIRVTEK